jgi:hypothetical protein
MSYDFKRYDVNLSQVLTGHPLCEALVHNHICLTQILWMISSFDSFVGRVVVLSLAYI